MNNLIIGNSHHPVCQDIKIRKIRLIGSFYLFVEFCNTLNDRIIQIILT